MYTIPTACPHRVRTLTQRGRGKQRSARLYFALPSEQVVNLCSAPAYLGACHPSPLCPGRKGITRLSPPSASSLLLAFSSAQFSLADWRRWLQIELFCPFHFSQVCIHLQSAVTSLQRCLFVKWKPFRVCLNLLHRLISVVAFGLQWWLCKKEIGLLLMLEHICRGKCRCPASVPGAKKKMHVS